MAVDIASVLEASGHERISVLKIDIEGAEAAVFDGNVQPWLRRVDCLLIEIHGETCNAAVTGVMAAEPFTRTECDELSVFRRIGQS